MLVQSQIAWGKVADRNTPQILILADDLSGAADCGLACKKAGLDTVVVLSDADDLPAAEALAIDADTRRSPPIAAGIAMARLIRIHARPGQVVFKS